MIWALMAYPSRSATLNMLAYRKFKSTSTRVGLAADSKEITWEVDI